MPQAFFGKLPYPDFWSCPRLVDILKFSIIRISVLFVLLTIAMLFLASKGYKVKVFVLGYSIDPPQLPIQQSISPAERLLSSVVPIEEDPQESRPISTEKTQAKNATELDISAAPESSGTSTKIAASTSGSSSKQRKNKKKSQ